MKFEIYQEPKPELFEIYQEPKPEPGEQVIRLRLFQESDSVVVRAVNKHGVPVDKEKLLSFTPDGKIHRAPYVSRTLGLDLDMRGKISLTFEG